MQVVDVPVRALEGATDPAPVLIKLGQFLKLANLVETGAAAKALIAAEFVQVNGEVESRRGRGLRAGDVVSVHADDGAQLAAARVVLDAAQPDPDDELGEYFDESTADDNFDPEKWRNL